ncbi:MAG: hypothetical protein GX181_04900 [Synergistaceae bacterium]|nr:hypothetical protein [Synergistaceae bacterium]
MDELKNNENRDLDSSVKEEETSLLLSAEPDGIEDDGAERAPVAAGEVFHSDDVQRKKARLIAKIREELETRRREDVTIPVSRRPRLERKNGFAKTVDLKERVEPIVEREKKSLGKSPPTAKARRTTVEGDAPRSFSQMVYGIPVLGYCVELVVMLLGLPLQLREINSRATKKEAVIQARIDGIGSRMNALRESLAQCRNELEESIASKIDQEKLEALSAELAGKADLSRLDEFSSSLDEELSKMAGEDMLSEVKSFIETSIVELRGELSLKAEGEQLALLEERLEEKAGEQALETLEKRIDEGLERLDSHYKVEVENRLRSLEASLEEAREEARRKADGEALLSLEGEIRSKGEALELLEGELRSKGEAFEALEREYRARSEADAESIRHLEERLTELSDRFSSFDPVAQVDSVRHLEERLAGLSDRFSSFDPVAQVDSVRHLEERLAGLSDRFSSFDPVAQVDSVRHLEERLAGLSDRFSSFDPVAQTDSVRHLEERLVELSDRFSSFDPESIALRVRSLEDVMESKADLEIIKSLLSLGVDVEVLKSLCKGLEAASADVVASLDKKADSAAYDALEGKIGSLLETIEAKADQSKIESMLSDKAGAEDLKDVRTLLEAKFEELRLIVEKQAEAADANESRMQIILEEVKAFVPPPLKSPAEVRKSPSLPYAARIKGRSAALQELKPGRERVKE